TEVVIAADRRVAVSRGEDGGAVADHDGAGFAVAARADSGPEIAAGGGDGSAGDGDGAAVGTTGPADSGGAIPALRRDRAAVDHQARPGGLDARGGVVPGGENPAAAHGVIDDERLAGGDHDARRIESVA